MVRLVQGFVRIKLSFHEMNASQCDGSIVCMCICVLSQSYITVMGALVCVLPENTIVKIALCVCVYVCVSHYNRPFGYFLCYNYNYNYNNPVSCVIIVLEKNFAVQVLSELTE